MASLSTAPCGASVSRATWRISARTAGGIGGASSTAPSGFSRCSGRRAGRLVPDHADQLAAAERHLDEGAGRRRRALGQPVVERPVERDGHQDGHDAADMGLGGRPALTGRAADSMIPRMTSAAGSAVLAPRHRRSRRRRREAGAAGCAAERRLAARTEQGLPPGPGQLRALPRRASRRRRGAGRPRRAAARRPARLARLAPRRGLSPAPRPRAPSPPCAASSASSTAATACTTRPCRPCARRACRTACRGRWPRRTPAT